MLKIDRKEDAVAIPATSEALIKPAVEVGVAEAEAVIVIVTVAVIETVLDADALETLRTLLEFGKTWNGQRVSHTHRESARLTRR